MKRSLNQFAPWLAAVHYLTAMLASFVLHQTGFAIILFFGALGWLICWAITGIAIEDEEDELDEEDEG